MKVTRLPPSPISSIQVLELSADHVTLLQDFFDANPAYFLAVQGEAAGPHEAHATIHGQLPKGWQCTRKAVIGYLGEDGALLAMADVVSDMLAQGVWHIGLFMVATSWHGNGTARTIYQGLEHWAIANGATWLRLGVVKGNTRAERFWERQGYLEIRTREDYPINQQRHTVRVMVKGMTGDTLESYLALVERDRPGAP